MARRPAESSWLTDESRERSGGAYALLGRAGGYDVVQRALGSARMHRLFLERCVKPEPGMTIVDVGAGTGDMREHLPGCRYVAIEPNPRYVEAMRRRFAGDGDVTIIEGTATALGQVTATADRIIFLGLLHHLTDDAASEAFREASLRISRGGRVATVDPCMHAGQSSVARALVKRDRGENVRLADGYGALARPWFGSVRLAVTDGLLPIPYSHAWLVCQPEPGGAV